MFLQRLRALFGFVSWVRAAVAGPEAIKPLPYCPKPAFDQLRLWMPGQAVVGLDAQSDQHPAAFRREVDAADLFVVFTVVDYQSLGNAEVLNRHPQG